MQKLNHLLRPFSSLKTKLGLYFIPICVLPLLVISVYTSSVFEKTFTQFLIEKARTEKEVILGEIYKREDEALQRGKAHLKSSLLIDFYRHKESYRLKALESNWALETQMNLYDLQGKLLYTSRKGTEGIAPFLSTEAKNRVLRQTETVDRYFVKEKKCLVTLYRGLVKTSSHVVGVLEEIYFFDAVFFAGLRQKANIDVILMNKSFEVMGASFAIGGIELHQFVSKMMLQGKSETPLFLKVGDVRYASFLFNLSAQNVKGSDLGYLAVFIPTSRFDQDITKIQSVLIYLTVFLVLLSLLLVFIFSNRVVNPIAALVTSMKKIKSGKVEPIRLNLETPYEIEYLVHSFNEMAKSILEAKTALEQKLEELAEKNREIQQAQSNVIQSAKMASLGQMVAGVAHELNNPIGFIYSNMHHLETYTLQLEELIRFYQQELKALPAEKLHKIQEREKQVDLEFLIKDLVDLSKSCMEGARRVKDIVLGLKTFSRSEESGFKPSSLVEGIQSTLKILQPEYKDRIRIIEHYEPIPLVECNLSQMNQVFMNLIANAIQSIEGSGEIRINVAERKQEVLVEISDSGLGMSKEVLEKMFDPFFTTKKVGEGTGLGLSIVYGIIQNHKGRIEVESHVGKGTTFRIWLPVRIPR